jgi:adenosyl cobinamide kinase/adenosyl cobinamide phosphate guanylyltransferase
MARQPPRYGVVCGLARQRLAHCADEVHLTVLGTHLRIKSEP